jgi:O-antigen/teichoic acid export membrane protein
MIGALLRKRQKIPADQRARIVDEHPDALDAAAYAGASDSPGQAQTSLSPAAAAGERAIMNTAYRTAGEITGRLASLLLFAQAGRSLGQSGLGAFVFAVVFTGIVMIPVNLGLDRYTLRSVAAERSTAGGLFFNVLALKLAIGVPVFGLSFLALHFTGASSEAQQTSWVMAPGVFCDSLARTLLAVFAAHERNGPPAAADTINRVLSAALGIAALRLGYGVVSVGVTYSIGSASAVVLGFIFMRRTIGIPVGALHHRAWPGLALRSLPFFVQDLFSTLLSILDTFILSVLATQTAVGRYGAAYRLFESTYFIPGALVGAFSAMYTYLRPDSNPPLNSVYQRSIKLAVTLMMPMAVAFTVLPGPICRLVYGSEFDSSATALRILGPGVALLGVITLTISLMVSRGEAGRTASLSGIMVAVNVALNLLLIPFFTVTGAATAMLATEVIFTVWLGHRALRTVGHIEWSSMLVGPLAASVGMAAVAALLHTNLAAALVAGGFTYLAVLVAVDWLISPRDVVFVAGMVRRRLSSRSAS